MLREFHMRKIFQNRIVFYGIALLFSAASLLYLRPHYSLGSDGINKLIQARSLQENHYSSEELYYPGRTMDPEFRFYPFQGVYLIHMPDGRHLGQYPLLYSYVLAFLGELLPMPEGAVALNWLLFVGTLFLLPFWNLTRRSSYLLLFGTYLLLMATDVSENIFSLFLYLGGLSLLYPHLEKERGAPWQPLLGGMLAGLSIWLRLEGVLFSGALLGGWLLFHRFRIRWSRPLALWFAGFTLVALAFFLFNFLDYGNPLGPRFMANEAGFFSSPLTRLIQTGVLLFAGGWKLGFFGFTPLFLVAFVGLLFSGKWDQLSGRDRFLYISTLIFLVGASFAAPNDGVVTWGPRYLAYAILPSLVFLDRFLGLFRQKRPFSLRVLLYGGFFWSFLALVVGLKFLNVATAQIRSFQETYKTIEADHVLFDSGWLASQLGAEYFRRPVYTVDDPSLLQDYFRALTENHRGERFALLSLQTPPSLTEGKNAGSEPCEEKSCEKGGSGSGDPYLSGIPEGYRLLQEKKLKEFTIRIYEIK